jgi:hypothetical protein
MDACAGAAPPELEETMSRPKIVSLALSALVALGGCDDGPSAPTQPIPSVAGTYYATWQLQFHRNRDGFSGSFQCYGTVTLAQSPARDNTATLSGFAVVGAPCPAQSFDLRGTMELSGAVRITTGAPRPPQGQCPGAAATQYEGVVTERDLALRASLEVNCPGPGEGMHRWDVIITAGR